MCMESAIKVGIQNMSISKIWTQTARGLEELKGLNPLELSKMSLFYIIL